MPNEEDCPYYWLSEDEWNKLQFRTRSQVSAILNPLRAYGQSVFVEGAIEELMVLFDLYGQVIRGKDIPLVVRNKPAPMTTE
jgi:reverse gyrase